MGNVLQVPSRYAKNAPYSLSPLICSLLTLSTTTPGVPRKNRRPSRTTTPRESTVPRYREQSSSSRSRKGFASGFRCLDLRSIGNHCHGLQNPGVQRLRLGSCRSAKGRLRVGRLLGSLMQPFWETVGDGYPSLWIEISRWWDVVLCRTHD
ncbi:hypothetical protein CC86DRAFT_213567 [Ophiobolus disseminans]|uniref:Uncharacterized protein n=1 Tax=Ophiobolus disseminans TaxID=1469910 RepID=A0A6A7A4I3_9PLEO|nr:hypothetical protein CC86DRAFT_213567 [Ophiobolus disseminans]